jgi:hypothetical protein
MNAAIPTPFMGGASHGRKADLEVITDGAAVLAMTAAWRSWRSRVYWQPSRVFKRSAAAMASVRCAMGMHTIGHAD